MRFPAIICIGMLGVFFWSFDWPLENGIVTATFGEYRQDHFHAGLDLSSQTAGGMAAPIRAGADGEIVFAYDEAGSFSSVPVGLGNYVAIQTQDNLRFLYCHLAAGSVRKEPVAVAAKDILGVMGDSGYSAGAHLHLGVFKTDALAFVNPYKVFPALADTKAPVISGMFAQKKGEIIPLADGKTLPEGEYAVFVRAADFRENMFAWKYLPYEVSLEVNGMPAGRIVFDSIASEAGETVVGADRKKLYELFRDGETYAGAVAFSPVRIPSGEVVLTARAKDFAGNLAEYSLRITVRSTM